MSPELFLPTEHTAALLLHLRALTDTRPPGRVVEIGTGSGVVLAALLAAGAASGLGIDIEPGAVECAAVLLRHQGHAARARVVQGDMWSPCASQRFDLAVANLPHFPATHIDGDAHLASWSCGGPDGRRWLDRFLHGLPEHLAPGGVAVITHNVFVDLERTRALVAPHGYAVTIGHTASVPIPAAKVASLTPEVRKRYAGRGLYQVGDYVFGDFHIVEIRGAADAAPTH